jgi:hypothetical protein
MKSSLAIFLVVSVTLISCKKDRSCTCSITTTQNTTTRTQTAEVSVTIPGFPPVVISPAKDTTAYSSSTYTGDKKTNYDKIRKGKMRQECPTSSDDSYTDSSTNTTAGTTGSGATTITTTRTTKNSYSCKIE